MSENEQRFKADKKWLITLVNSIKEEINVDEVISGSDTSRFGVGTSQFRELAAECRAAESYEEIELLIKYKMAKDNKQNTWRKSDNNTNLGKVILSKISTIHDRYGESDENCLEAISLFFGYLFQSAKVWKMSSGELDSNRPNHNRPNNNYKKNNKRGGWK